MANECEARHFEASILYPGECKSTFYIGNIGKRPINNKAIIVPEELFG